MLQCRSILFDCDGVLVDSTAASEHAWQRWAREYDVPYSKVLEGLHGRRSRDTVARFLAPADVAEATAKIEELELESAGRTTAIPGARRLLASLPENWAVVTSASRELFEARLAAADLPSPKVTVTAESVQMGKPAPDGYRLAAKQLGVGTSSCVVMEDSAAGILAAFAASVRHVIGVGPHARTSGVKHLVPDLTAVRWSGVGLIIPD
jgi:mannitol-1-/sugar-/sorbitol-6-phosphatase